VRVLIADDHALFRDGITSLLEAAGFEVIGQVGDGQAAIDSVTSLQPDLALIDISMPICNGLEALEQIKSKSPETRIVILTVSDEDADLFTAIEAGADGYLLKSLGSDEFISSLRALEKGELSITRKTATRLIEGLVRNPENGNNKDKLITERELELLCLVAGGLTNKAIAQELSISENTVKYHLKKILQKLGAQNRTEAVSSAISLGLIEPPTEA
jgi:DNA-binding NarL/FixJ family response regulator